jgi:hypothetical protein
LDGWLRLVRGMKPVHRKVVQLVANPFERDNSPPDPAAGGIFTGVGVELTVNIAPDVGAGYFVCWRGILGTRPVAHNRIFWDGPLRGCWIVQK